MSLIVPGGGSRSGWRFLAQGAPLGVPGTPTGVTAVAGNGQALVSWTAPPANGSPITNNTVTTYPGAAPHLTGPGVISYLVTGLTNGVPVTFTVASTNAIGTGLPSGQTVAVTPSGGGGGPIPMVTGAIFSNYALAVNGDWEFAEMASMTGAAFLASQSVWSVAPYYQFMDSNNFDLSLLSIVNGKGLVLFANDPRGVGIWTNPYGSDYGVPSGNFTVAPPFYREVSFIYQSVAGHNVNWGASWLLGLSPSGTGYIENSAELDMNEIDNGQMYTNVHSQNSTSVQSQPASYGVTSSTPTTYRIGLYVTTSQITVYWDGGNSGTPVIAPAGGSGKSPASWPGESLSSSTRFFLMHTNTSPGYSGDVVYDSSTVPNIIVYDRTFIPG